MRKNVVRQAWRQFVELLPDAVLCADKQGGLILVNQASIQLLGYSRLELLSLNLSDLIYNDKINVSSLSVSHDPDVNVFVKHASGRLVPVIKVDKKVDLFAGITEAFEFIILRDKHAINAFGGTLVHEKNRFEFLFNSINDAVFLAPVSKDGVHGNFVEVNDVACNRLGYSRDELLKMNARTLNPQANYNRIKSFGRNIKREGKTEFEAIHVARDGSHIPVSVCAKVISMDGEDYILSVTRDLREETELSRSRNRLGKLMEHSWEEIYIFDSVTLFFLQVNQGARDNLGYSNRELMELTPVDIKPELNEAEFRAMVQPLLEGRETQLKIETTHQRKDGTTYPVEIRLQISHNEVPPVFLANVQDITERKKTEQRLQYLATYDALTGLPNRSLFMDRLRVAIEQGRRSGLLSAVMYLDLDGFKNINDALGHEAGDLYIKEISRRLVQSVRKSDTVSRMGGDEFTVILSDLNSVVDAEAVAKKIIESVSDPFLIFEQEVQSTISVGVTMFPFGDADDAASLIKQADAAMYNAKATGKNNFQFFTMELAREATSRVRMEHALRSALKNNEFELHYQPRINFSTGDVVGVEALLRWRNDELGAVGPDQFIPVLESSGKIKEVGHWVLEQACKQQVEWLAAGIELRVSVNVSARQFEDGLFFFQLEEAIEVWGVKPESLEIEITEGMLLKQDKNVQLSLGKIRDLGVSISLDDFGTGYSSLSYLKQYPIDILKIDRSFINDLGVSSDSGAIVDAIISMAKSLKMRVTAEGIEEERHADFLRERHCEEGQGFLYGRPMPVSEFVEFLRRRNKGSAPAVTAIPRY